jgi:hypothetical protein
MRTRQKECYYWNLKTCIIYIGLSAVSTTHPYPANSLAGLGGWVGGRAGPGRASAKGPQRKTP